MWVFLPCVDIPVVCSAYEYYVVGVFVFPWPGLEYTFLLVLGVRVVGCILEYFYLCLLSVLLTLCGECVMPARMVVWDLCHWCLVCVFLTW
jgi:hypothetical protein